ncbi:unnamed protein product [Pseudo-nitzschia multistriata]|uniref:Uncharacterized protein n=1 Tax=Pseudo-nitzschia multistriata TaxID=183589 RepID=A0A448Z6D8_9STRA|nr:unnamed protein product [Pseudo-nitzschia multistriata]
MTGKIRDVDICITCVTEKAPKLPLREELPSLGIELVYNAKGVGAAAAEEERKKEAESNRKRKQLEKNKSTIDPPSRSPFPSLKARRSAQKEDPPEESPFPKALSYGKYQRKLELRTKPIRDAASMSSTIETTSTINDASLQNKEKKTKRGKLLGLFGKKKKNASNEPPTSVEFPSSNSVEDAALKEVFNTFMSNDGDDVPAKAAFDALPPKSDTKRKENTSVEEEKILFPDLLPGSKSSPEQLETESSPETNGSQSEGNQSSSIEQTTISSLGHDSSVWKHAIVSDAESFTKRAKDMLQKISAQRERVASPSGSGNIKVKLLKDGLDNQITEIYDLTEVSENGDKNPQQQKIEMRRIEESKSRHSFPHSHHQSVADINIGAKDSPYVVDVSDEESSVPVPVLNDNYGYQILDVADIYEENGPGSPLVLSPVQIRRTADASEFSPSSVAIPHFGEEKKQNPLLPPSYYNQTRNDGFVDLDGRDDVIVYRVESQMSPNLRDSNISPIRVDIADPYMAPSKRARKTGMKMPTFDEAVQKYYESRGHSPSRLPSTMTPHLNSTIRKCASRDSNDSARVLKVTFSEDIEERYYQKDQFGNQSSSAMNSSLATAIVNTERDAIEPISSTLRREADEALVESYADQLDQEDDMRTPQQMLLEALSFGDPLPFDFEETIHFNPSIASKRLPSLNTFALHAACFRAFPKRFGKDQTCRINDLIDDLTLYRKLIEVLVEADPYVCQRVNENGDLPVHIMARHLMEWEGRWYQKVYDKARNSDEEPDSGSGITKLYQSMSECINLVLQPISEVDSLCLHSGSVGRILPLHIAAIFTVPYSTLRSLLETCPNAASTMCDLGDIKTFVPNDSTPLELHDRLSTDFPKWEIQKVNFHPDEEMTQAMLDKIYGTMNAMRRSDLMFAFSPKLLPYRNEAYRMRRMEHMIQKEIKYQDTKGNYVMTRPATFFWIWMCEFQGEDDPTDHYAESISRIIDHLPYLAVRYLASVVNEEGKAAIDCAIPICADVIMDRLYRISNTDIPMLVHTVPGEVDTTIGSPKLREFDKENSLRFRFHGQGYVGSLCRTIFHIQEKSYPSSFIILPYKLVQDGKGGLGLESPAAAKIAMEFAGHLSRLTSPKNIVSVLDKKLDEFFGHDLVDKMNRENRESQLKREESFDKFLKLYENGPAYFYFVDDCTGVPIVNDTNGVYPLIVNDAAEVVEKVFPLMLSGMILMRGENALSILADVLLFENIKLVLPHWIEAAKDLVAFSFSPESTKLLSKREKLINFIQYGSTENDASEKFKSGDLSSEWVLEVSLIKMMVEMHDVGHNFCGLLQETSVTQVLWTRNSQIHTNFPSQINFTTPKLLKVSHSNTDKNATKALRNKLNDNRKYDEMFAEMSLTESSSDEKEKGSSSEEYTDTDCSSEDKVSGMIVTASERNNSQSVASQLTEHRQAEHQLSDKMSLKSDESLPPMSLASSDESFDIRTVMKLRFQLDEQESKLKQLRQKISHLDTVGGQLVQQEEKITSMIGEIINQKDQMLHNSSKDGLTKARALMMRICELEDRVLCREVEVGQLKNDVSFFQLEASVGSESRAVDGTSYSSRNREVLENNPNENMETPDEDINSLAPFSVRRQVPLVDDDESNDGDSTLGNSTMYNSSLDGYPVGMLN